MQVFTVVEARDALKILENGFVGDGPVCFVTFAPDLESQLLDSPATLSLEIHDLILREYESAERSPWEALMKGIPSDAHRYAIPTAIVNSIVKQFGKPRVHDYKYARSTSADLLEQAYVLRNERGSSDATAKELSEAATFLDSVGRDNITVNRTPKRAK